MILSTTKVGRSFAILLIPRELPLRHPSKADLDKSSSMDEAHLGSNYAGACHRLLKIGSELQWGQNYFSRDGGYLFCWYPFHARPRNPPPPANFHNHNAGSEVSISRLVFLSWSVAIIWCKIWRTWLLAHKIILSWTSVIARSCTKGIHLHFVMKISYKKPRRASKA